MRIAIARAGRSNALRAARSSTSIPARLLARPYSDDKITRVNIDDEASQSSVDGFFNYTWGKWLVNDAAEKAKRQTKFSLKGLVEVLNQNVPKTGDAPASAQLEVNSITVLYEGQSNKLYQINLVDGRTYILRIPYQLGPADFRRHRMNSEVATMDFLRKKHDLKIPTVLGWSPSQNNPLGSEYMLLEFIDGHMLMKSWQPGSESIEEKASVIKPIADFFTSISSTKFNRFGSLYFTEDVDPKYQSDLAYDGESDTTLADRWRIGPTTETAFWRTPASGTKKSDLSSLRGPFNSVGEYLAATAAAQLACLGSDSDPAAETFKQYAKLAPELFDADKESLKPEILAPRLNVPDLSPVNVLVSGSDNYLVDLESTAIRPFLLHGAPEFVEHRGLKVFSLEEVPEFEKMPAEQQNVIRHMMAQTQNMFAFDYLLRQQLTDEMFTAFLPSIKRRQQLVGTALKTNAYKHQDLAHDIAILSQEWSFLVPDREFPIKFTEQDLEEIAKKTEEWNKTVLSNPFLETDGWVPIDTFEALEKEGRLKKEGDDYVWAN